jgi:hypothetical protein
MVRFRTSMQKIIFSHLKTTCKATHGICRTSVCLQTSLGDTKNLPTLIVVISQRNKAEMSVKYWSH